MPDPHSALSVAQREVSLSQTERRGVGGLQSGRGRRGTRTRARVQKTQLQEVALHSAQDWPAQQPFTPAESPVAGHWSTTSGVPAHEHTPETPTSHTLGVFDEVGPGGPRMCIPHRSPTGRGHTLGTTVPGKLTGAVTLGVTASSSFTLFTQEGLLSRASAPLHLPVASAPICVVTSFHRALFRWPLLEGPP